MASYLAVILVNIKRLFFRQDSVNTAFPCIEKIINAVNF